MDFQNISDKMIGLIELLELGVRVQVLLTALHFSALPMGTAFNQALGVLVFSVFFPALPLLVLKVLEVTQKLEHLH